MSIGKLLIDDQPLQVLPSLAKAIGLNEALILQQIHWLLLRSKKEFNGKYWVFNTYEEWQEKHFRFFSVSTIRRTINRLEELDLLISTTEFNQMKVDKTKWYTINYEALENLDFATVKNDSPPAQNEQTSSSNWAEPPAQNEQTNNQEIPQEIPTKDNSTSGKNFPPAKAGKKFVYTDDDLRAANWIFGLIKNLSPNVKTPTFESWANEIRLMRERDGRTHKDICELFKWANEDEFWSANILSPSKLRDKWDQLEIKRKSSKTTKRKESFAEKNSSDWSSPEKMAGAF